MIKIDHGILWWWDNGYCIFKDIYFRTRNSGYPDNEYRWFNVDHGDCYWMILDEGLDEDGG